MKATTYKERLNRAVWHFPSTIRHFAVPGIPSLAAIKCKAQKHVQAYPQPRAVFCV